MRRVNKRRFNFLRFLMSKAKDKDGVTVKERIVLKGISLILAIFFAMILLGTFALFKMGSSSMPEAISPSSDEPVNILLLGMDVGDVKQEDNDSIKRTDTIMLLNYHPKTKSMNVVAIPRDTLIKVNNKSVKINSAFAIGGYKKIKAEVENLLGININYLVKIDYNAFREVIDAIGGVEMTIERNMYYDDEGQNLHIDFKAGETVKLDGAKAEQFFRWRKNNDGTGFANGDLDRIQNQQKFLSKVVDKCTSPFIIFRVPVIMKALADNVETNMSPFSIINYGFKFMFMDKSELNMTTAAGTPKMIGGQSFLIFDKNANRELISSLNSSSSSGGKSVAKDNVRIKILNATKINGLAGEAKKALNILGYDKIDTGNYIDIQDKSQVLCNDKTLAKSIKSSIGIKNIEEKPSKTEYADYDVIIIIGKDYKELGK